MSSNVVRNRIRTALWYVPVPDLGGVARHVLDTVRQGVRGWRVVVLCPEGDLAHRLRVAGAPVLIGPVSPADGPISAVRSIRRTLRRVRPDILHTHLAFADLTGIVAAVGLSSAIGRRIRVVSTEHGICGIRGYYQTGTVRHRATAAAHRLRLRRTDRLIAVSESTAREVRAQWGSGCAIAVIRNGIEARPPLTHPMPGLKVVSLARLAPEKRIDALVRAFALVADENPQAMLTIAGAGPEETALQNLVASLGIESRVRFPGHIEPAEALNAHDVVVQLSIWENLSYTLLDAVARGLGVVATDVGGNREVLPEECLTDTTERRAVALKILEQGNEPQLRPIAETRLDVAGMTDAISRVYMEMGA